ncbi:MAG: hypothetical protein HRU38_18765 [Saccharospirillaceae bacterium]|nr:hypothetical protein [Pseudomonadales bacterium]NRB80678.1 hypothetical protein [Saccharospirillaceae bacterium]
MKSAILLLCAITFLTSCQSVQYVKGIKQVKTINGKYVNRNITVNNPLKCVGQNKVSNTDTPADIMMGVQDCLESSDFKKGAFLYLYALNNAKYDTFRVSDKTSHTIIDGLAEMVFSDVNQTELNSFKLYIQETLSNNTSFCSTLIKEGRPSYHPLYMVMSGNKYNRKNLINNGLVQGYDPDKNWQDTLVYSGCKNELNDIKSEINSTITNHFKIIDI